MGPSRKKRAQDDEALFCFHSSAFIRVDLRIGGSGVDGQSVDAV